MILIAASQHPGWEFIRHTLRRVERQGNSAVARSRAAGYPVDIKSYPDAHHSFDNNNPVRYDVRRNNSSSLSGHGATTGGNPSDGKMLKKKSRRSSHGT